MQIVLSDLKMIIEFKLYDRFIICLSIIGLGAAVLGVSEAWLSATSAIFQRTVCLIHYLWLAISSGPALFQL